MRFAYAMLFMLAFSVAADTDDDPGLNDWTTHVKMGGPEDIADPPRTYVEFRSETGTLRFTIYNHTNTTYKFFGYSRQNPQLFFAKRVNGQIKGTNWYWCGTGMRSFELPPQAAIQWEQPADSGSMQGSTMLGMVFHAVGKEKKSRMVWFSHPISKQVEHRELAEAAAARMKEIEKAKSTSDDR